jgi:hypothetical protein
MSVSLESRCPSCRKEFPNDSCVLRHMNSPQTSCQNWLQFLASAVQGVSGPSTTAHPHPSSRTNSTTAHPLPSSRTNGTTAHPHPSSRTNNTTNDNESASDDTLMAAHYEDVHRNTPSFFGSGPTFMDKFNADPSADKRQENLYYPFWSREEWGLASWLLCSGLSMRAINDFLALPIVSFHALHHPFVANQIPRYNAFHSPSPLQKRCVVVWTSSRRPPSGRCKNSHSMDTVLRSRSHSFTAILSNALRPSYKTQSSKENGISSPKRSTTVLTDGTGSTTNG